MSGMMLCPEKNVKESTVQLKKKKLVSRKPVLRNNTAREGNLTRIINFKKFLSLKASPSSGGDLRCEKRRTFGNKRVLGFLFSTLFRVVL